MSNKKKALNCKMNIFLNYLKSHNVTNITGGGGDDNRIYFSIYDYYDIDLNEMFGLIPYNLSPAPEFNIAIIDSKLDIKTYLYLSYIHYTVFIQTSDIVDKYILEREISLRPIDLYEQDIIYQYPYGSREYMNILNGTDPNFILTVDDKLNPDLTDVDSFRDRNVIRDLYDLQSEIYMRYIKDHIIRIM